MQKTSAMILAGGRGKRMGILCDSRPKPALPFAGDHSVIDFTLSNCLNSGISNIGVLTGYQGPCIRRHIKSWQALNAPDTNITALEPRTGLYAGTADAVYRNLSYLSHHDANTALILAADHIYKMDYREMIEFHHRIKADVTVAVIQIPMEKAGHFGTVFTDAQSRILNFIEKPVRPMSNLVSMGIYVFNILPLSQYLIEDSHLPDSIHDFGHVILPRMVKQARVFAYQFEGYWQDIGTPEAYHRANLHFAQANSTVFSDQPWPIYSNQIKHQDDKIQNGSRWKDSIIGPGCVIKGKLENSVLSPGVWVGENAVVRNSVIMSNVTIGRNTIVNSAVLDEGVATGEYCQIGNSDKTELTLLGQNTKIPSHHSIGAEGIIIRKVHSIPSGLQLETALV